MGSDNSMGNLGCFFLPAIISNRRINCIASDGSATKEFLAPWEHVSVSIQQGSKFAIPCWREMQHVKEIFWDDEDVVMQLHPRKSEYINNNQYVLHLWRPVGQAIPEPPSILVGYKDNETYQEELLRGCLISWKFLML